MAVPAAICVWPASTAGRRPESDRAFCYSADGSPHLHLTMPTSAQFNRERLHGRTYRPRRAVLCGFGGIRPLPASGYGAGPAGVGQSSSPCHPGNTDGCRYPYCQWNVGTSSLLAHAVGLAPSKDNFWTTAVQPGNRYHFSWKCPPPALKS
eukprot:gene17870-biopygen35064